MDINTEELLKFVNLDDQDMMSFGSDDDEDDELDQEEEGSQEESFLPEKVTPIAFNYKKEYKLNSESTKKYNELLANMFTTDYEDAANKARPYFKPAPPIVSFDQYKYAIDKYLQIGKESIYNRFEASCEQYRACLSQAMRILISAGAGTGKTAVMTRIIQYDQFIYNWSEADILCTTYTDKAADSMRDRYYSIARDYKSTRSIDVTTLHSFCLRILKSFSEVNVATIDQPYTYVKYTSRGEEKTQLIYLDKLMHEVLVQFYQQKLIPSSQSVIQALSIIAELCIENEEDYRKEEAFREYPLSFSELQSIKKVYDAKKASYNIVDYGDCLLNTYKFLHSIESLDDPNINQYTRRILTKKAIYIDEYQDISPLQDLIIDEILRLNPMCKLVCIGDCDQAIYSFRGACIQSFINFPKKYINMDVDIIALTINRRSGADIINIANDIISHNTLRITTHMRPLNNYTTKIGYLIDKTEQHLLHKGYLTKLLSDIDKNANVLGREYSILYREHSQIKPYLIGLIKNRIPFSISDNVDKSDIFPFNYQIVSDIIGITNMLQRPKDYKLVEDNLRLCVPGMDAKDLNSILNIYMSNPDTKLLSILKSKEKYAPYVPLLIDLYNSLYKKESVLKIFSMAIDLYEKAVIKPKLSKKNANQKKILQEFELAKEYLLYNPKIDLKEFKRLKTLDKEWCRKNTCCYNSVQFLTFHSAKGLENTNIILLGIGDNTSPKVSTMKKMSEENQLKYLEEERRLFYVAVTRAVKSLTLLLEDEGIFAKEFLNAFNKLGLKNQLIA